MLWIIDVPWYVKNECLHKDLNTVKEEIESMNAEIQVASRKSSKHNGYILNFFRLKFQFKEWLNLYFQSHLD